MSKFHAVEYNEGDKYQGMWSAEGKREGFGVLEFADGTKFAGDFGSGLFHGKGVLTFNDRSKYEGEFQNGKYHGFGVYTRADGMKFEGEFKNGEVNGSGLLTFPDGSNGQPRQEGTWQGTHLVKRGQAGDAVSRAQQAAITARTKKA
eukprot:m.4898 g.4898  ORF g.4898 m.4898 type:complete len:147 (-) comp2308_c0_seq1:1401-1841(-)